jgi:hypothetical protein
MIVAWLEPAVSVANMPAAIAGSSEANLDR